MIHHQTPLVHTRAFTWCVISGLMLPGFLPLLTIIFLCWSQFNSSKVFPTWEKDKNRNDNQWDDSGRGKQEPIRWVVRVSPSLFLRMLPPEQPPAVSPPCGRAGSADVWLVWVHIRPNAPDHASSPPWLFSCGMSQTLCVTARLR